jgi:hypothetical protein
MIDAILEIFFNKYNFYTPNATLATLNDNRLISGYIGKDVSFYTHVNYYTVKKALESLIKYNQKNFYQFVETGCAASHGTKSTLLWDIFVNQYNGRVDSVDLSINNVLSTRQLVSNKTQVHHSDSVEYLKTFNKNIDFLYLDSYDCDFFNDNGSSLHHFNELKSIENQLIPNQTIILIDDTPINKYWMDGALQRDDIYKISDEQILFGKGNLVNEYLETKTSSVKLLHQYQTVWLYKN